LNQTASLKNQFLSSKTAFVKSLLFQVFCEEIDNSLTKTVFFSLTFKSEKLSKKGCQGAVFLIN